MSAMLPQYRSWFARLNDRRTTARARVFVPILFGVFSVALGQDANWDLFNYHLYNPFAFSNGKFATDLAPAGFQSFFNPVLDLPYYAASLYLPAPVVGFLLGWLHGLAFPLVLAIASRILVDLPPEDRYRTPLFLAAAGCLTANFLSGLGNTMGDNATALFGLAAIVVLLQGWDRILARPLDAAWIVAGAGILLGLGVGLKLTNATYVLAACAALLTVPVSWSRRLGLAVAFGSGAAVGVATTGGYWLFEMWQTFGNPVFPQFGNLFPNPLAKATATYDTVWRPHDGLEVVLWPFVIAVNPLRVGQAVLHQVIWPLVYVLAVAWLAVGVTRTLRRKPMPMQGPRARFVLAFVGVGFVVWMLQFGVYRYLVTVELLAPLAAFILAAELWRGLLARRIAAWTIGAATLVVVLGGVQTWGHEGWGLRAFRAELPRLEQPAQTSVVILARDPPLAWLATLFPPEVAFVSVGSELLDTPGYAQRVREVLGRRHGPVYAIVEGHYNWRADNIAAANSVAAATGLTVTEARCDLLRSVIDGLGLRAVVVLAAPDRCRLELQHRDHRDIAAENLKSAESVAGAYAAQGLSLQTGDCIPFSAYVGRKKKTYQLCLLTVH